MDKTEQKKFPSKLSMLAERLSSIYSSSHTMDRVSSYSGSKVNIVTEAASVLPSLASTFSLEQPRGLWLAGRETSNLSDAGQVSMSMQEGLQYDDYEDEFDNPDYIDTVKSNDSFLKRSLSVPARPNPYEGHRHMKDIFGIGDDDDLQVEGESEEDKKWRQTMDDLLENPEYINSLESQSSHKVLLAKAAIKFAIDSKVHAGVQHNYVKALIVLSIGFMQVFLAYMALRNLQSSLNSRGGLGLYVLTCAYAFLLIGCIFAPTIVQFLRPKRTILFCMIGILVFILTNVYPTVYLLIPAACMVGFSLACLWTAHSTYMTSIAMSYASQKGKNIQHVLTKFNGIFFMMFQAAQIIGGALSSVILTMSAGDSESSRATTPNDSISTVNLTDVSYKHCGASYSHSMASTDTVDISPSTVYVMLGIFATFATVGIVVILFCLDGLEGTMKKSHRSIGGRLLATFTFLFDQRVVLLMGLMCYSFLQMSFMLGEFTKAFVTCSVGVQKVGYVMMTQAFFSAFSSFLSDKLQRYFGRTVIIFTAASLQMAMLIVMLMGQPSPDTIVILFIVAGFWGFADGLLITQLISLFGLLFSDNKEAAFAGLKMCQSSAAVCFFVSAPYLDTNVKIFAMMVILVIAIVGYVILETRLERIRKQNVNTNRNHGTPV